MPTASRRASDPRPARTRAALLEAVQRMAQNGDSLSVGRIVSASGVSRSAFYTHFANLDELALEMLVREFAAIGEDDAADRAARTDDVAAIAYRAASRLTSFMMRKREMYRASLNGELSTKSSDALIDAYARAVLKSMDFVQHPPPAPLTPAGHARFIAGGAIALLRDWLNSDDPVPAEAMTAQLLAAMPTWLVGDITRKEEA